MKLLKSWFIAHRLESYTDYDYDYDYDPSLPLEEVKSIGSSDGF